MAWPLRRAVEELAFGGGAEAGGDVAVADRLFGAFGVDVEIAVGAAQLALKVDRQYSVAVGLEGAVGVFVRYLVLFKAGL